VARTIRETVLGQSAHDPNDAVSTLEKTHRLAALALGVHRAGRRALEAGRAFEQLDLATPRRLLAALRRAPAGEVPARAAETQAALEALTA
jgi:vacuolar-type H+-ATPase catalytic subunit A/Vma1